jgi:hypothetical protein
MNIDHVGLENAMEHLAATDIEYAERKGALEDAEILRKSVRARVFLTTSGNNEERKARAEIDVSVLKADDEYIFAVTEFERLRAQRQRSESYIEIWRSVEASRRRT